MQNTVSSRRNFLKRAAATAAVLPMPTIAQGAPARVVIVGGGFAGATCAHFVKHNDPRIAVTLVEASPTFTACPFSNAVIADAPCLESRGTDIAAAPSARRHGRRCIRSAADSV